MTNSRRSTAWLLSTCTLALLPAHAFSQEQACSAKDQIEIPAQCQTSEANDGDEAVMLDEITLLGNKAPVEVLKYPGSVTIVDFDEETQASTAIEALKNVPGFGSGGDRGRSAGQQYSVRGFGYQSEQRVIVKVDGVKRSPSLFSNHVSSFRTDPTIVKRAEVAKGGSTMLHGSGAIGGVVAMQTKDAYDYLPDGQNVSLTTSLRYESNNERSGTLTWAGASKTLPIDFMLHGRVVDAGDVTLADGGANGTTKTDNDSTTYNGFAKLGIDLSDDQRLVFSLQSYTQDLNTVWQTLYHSEIDLDDPVIGELVQREAVAHYSFDPAGNDLIDFEARAYASNGYYDRGYEVYDLQYKNENTRWGTALKNIARFNTGSFSHRLTTGLDYEHLEEDSSYVRGGVVSPFAMHPATSTDLGIYIQDEITTADERFTLTLGGRFDKFTRQVDGGREFSGENFAPRIGAAYEVANGITLLANYAETFRAPLVTEYAAEGAQNPHYWYIPNADLEPEKAKEYEIGFSVDKDGLLSDTDSLRFKAMYFEGDIEDMIILEALGRDPIPGYGPLSPDHDNHQQFAQYQNIAAAKRRGLEVGADYWVNDWHLEMSFEHLDIYDKETREKTPQGYADKLHLAAAYTYQPWDLTLGAEVNHWFKPDQNPDSFVSRGTTYYRVRDDYTLANIKGTWKPKTGKYAGVELVAGVNNVFDKQYINARYSETTSMVGKERNYFVQLKKTF